MHAIPLAEDNWLRVRPRRRAPSSELELIPEVQAAIVWNGQDFRLRRYRGVRYIEDVQFKGIYIALRANKPVLVGVTWARSIGNRWKHRLAVFRELGIPATTLLRSYTVRVGRILPTGNWKGRKAEDLYQSVERVLIRYLKDVKGHRLANTRGSKVFTVAAPGISLVNRGTKPTFLPPVIRRSTGQNFESESGMRL